MSVPPPLLYQPSFHQLDADEESGGFEENDVQKVQCQARRRLAGESGAGDIDCVGKGKV